MKKKLLKKTTPIIKNTNEESNVLIDVSNLSLEIKKKKSARKGKKIVENVSFRLHKKEVLAFVGESGCGKTVLTSTLMGLAPKGSVYTTGSIKIKEQDVTKHKEKQWQKLRGSVITKIFQNPLSTLNPVYKVGKQIRESFLIHKITKSKKEAKEKALHLMRQVKIKNPERVYNLFPHEISGGQKQRIVICAALACNPEVIIFDEPTTALDPTVEAEILKIIRELQNSFNKSAIFITHDLGVVSSIANRIAVMYAGKIVEIGTAREVLFNSQHPYTWGLIMSSPDVNSGNKRLHSIHGSVPLNIATIKGDAFAPRNDYSLNIDFVEKPDLKKISETHYAATWLLDDKAPEYSPPTIIKDRWDKFKKGLV